MKNKSRWLTDAERWRVANDWAAGVALFPHWTGKVWFKGSVCRVYLRFDGKQAGYLSIFEDGSVRTSLSGDTDAHHMLDILVPFKTGNRLPDWVRERIERDRERFREASWTWFRRCAP